MLAEQRYDMILELVNKNGSVTVSEIRDLLNASEATIRRDITTLHNSGKLIKVFGGAIANSNTYSAKEQTVAQKVEMNHSQKLMIGKYAASLIENDEFVYIDAGTSTACMLEYINVKDATFVTNAVAHAQYLAKQGAKVYMIGGELKSSTEAIVGNAAAMSLTKYNFTKGFFGTNGVSRKNGLTTPEVDEAVIKEVAMKRCKTSYVLADSTKFSNTTSIRFGDIEDATIITDHIPNGYEKYKNIILAE